MKVKRAICQVSMILDRRVSIDDWRIDDFQIDIFRSMISRPTIDGFKKMGELDDPEFGTLDVNTGSSRSTVASEEADVGVMFSGEVEFTGVFVQKVIRMHGPPALYAGGRCRGRLW